MNRTCEIVIISDKAYNAIIRESFAKHPVETGGIFLGYILDNGLWVVMEMIPPGINGVFQTAYFEYDQDFVNYLGTSVANQYREPLQVLGLWHRHPGSMDYFSSTDDATNSDFASKNPYGVISGLVNIDPSFRLTMYHLDRNNGVRPRNIAYSTVDVEIGDDLIPEKFFKLRYVDDEHSELHPTPTHINTQASHTKGLSKVIHHDSDELSAQNMPSVIRKSPIIHSKPTPLCSKNWFIPTIVALTFITGCFVGMKLIPVLCDKNKTVEASQSSDSPSLQNNKQQQLPTPKDNSKPTDKVDDSSQLKTVPNNDTI